MLLAITSQRIAFLTKKVSQIVALGLLYALVMVTKKKFGKWLIFFCVTYNMLAHISLLQ